MLPRYWLAPHVVSCTTDTAVVLLDLQHDRYHALPAQAAEGLADIVQGWPSASHTAISPHPPQLALDQLLRSGLLTTAPEPQLFEQQAKISRPLVSVVSNNARVRPKDVLRFGLACRWAWHALRHHSLLQTAIHLTDAKRAISRTADGAAVADHVSRFRTLRAFTFTAQDRCLFHALALTQYLLRLDIPATWLIGVRTQPWSAHSWVQLDGELLDAAPDQVAPFRVILAI